jgi:exosortase
LQNMHLARHKQVIYFAAIALASLVLAVGPGRHLLDFAYHTGDQSYILLVPLLSAILVYRDQSRIFATTTSGISRASLLGFLVGMALIALGYVTPSGSELQMAVTAVGLVSVWTGAFVFCFGEEAAWAAIFPLAMLLWIVPIPLICIDSMIHYLQVGSTELVAVLFRLTGVPVLREGFVFHLPGQSIEVAKECSGIRSSLCLILLTLVIAHESLRGNARRAILIASTIPIVVLKNGVRIVSLTLLAIYVDPSFLTGSLHHEGGIVFFLIGMVMLIPLLALLRRGEKEVSSLAQASAQSVVASR